MRLRSAIVVTTLFATPIAAMAQPITGLYVGGGAGLHAPQDPKASTLGPGFGAGTIGLKENFGFNSNLAIGYGIGNGFRFEVEGDFMRSGLRQFGTPFPTASQRHGPHLGRDGQRALRYGYRHTLHLPLSSASAPATNGPS